MWQIPENKRPKFIEKLTPAAVTAGFALVCWPVSAVTALAVDPHGSFIDFWLGMVSILSAVGGMVAMTYMAFYLVEAAAALTER